MESIKKQNSRRALILGLKIKSKGRKNSKAKDEAEYSLDELARLLDTLGYQVAGREFQYKDAPSPATYIGKGKAFAMKDYCKDNEITAVVVNDDLTASQARNLSNIIKLPVYDRTEIILEIFLEHARTKEAKIQVEIAKQEFMLSRVLGLWAHFDRQKGGIGLRDVGEKQIELDRRLIRDRISKLKKNLKNVISMKEMQRKSRQNILQVALVGYTNAGKTTIMNKLTDSQLLVEDKLFATLDSTVKILNPENRPRILMSDTVGFIDKLPHKLIASFKSTLDELFSADLILHVVDVSSENYEKHIKITHDVLDELKVSHKPSFIVFNKADALDKGFLFPKLVKRKYLESIVISAYNHDDVVSLRDKVIDFFEKQMLDIEVEIPYAFQEKISEIYTFSRVLEKKYNEDSVYMKFKIANIHYDRLELSNYILKKNNWSRKDGL